MGKVPPFDLNGKVFLVNMNVGSEAVVL